MRALLFRQDGKVTEFEVRGSPPYFILVEPDKELADNDGPIGIVKGKEILFRRLVDYGGNSVAQYAEDGIKPSYFKARAVEAAGRFANEYAREMKYMADAVARPEFLAPVVGKIERYAANVPKQYFAPTKFNYEVSSPKQNFIKPDPYMPEPIKKFNAGPKWDPPFQTVYVDDKSNVYEDEEGNKPFSNITYTPKPEPPPREPDVIGEPKKRLILINKEDE